MKWIFAIASFLTLAETFVPKEGVDFYGEVDILFILDTSSSMEKYLKGPGRTLEGQNLKDLLVSVPRWSVFDRLDVGSNNIRGGILTYNDGVSYRFSIQQFNII